MVALRPENGKVMQLASTQPPRNSKSFARKSALAGIGLFLIGFGLGGVGNSAETLLWITPFGDTLTGLGFVLSLLGAARAGSSAMEMVIIGIIFGVGTFYLGEPHLTHIQSGFGFGLEHPVHIFTGLGLVAAATAIASVLAFYHTREPKKK